MIELTGLRKPCFKLDRIAPGLMQAVLEKGAGKTIVRKAGVMAVVIASGDVSVGDSIEICAQPATFAALAPV